MIRAGLACPSDVSASTRLNACLSVAADAEALTPQYREVLNGTFHFAIDQVDDAVDDVVYDATRAATDAVTETP